MKNFCLALNLTERGVPVPNFHLMTRPYGRKFLEFIFSLALCCQGETNEEIENLSDSTLNIVCEAIQEQNEELKVLRQKTRGAIKESEAEIARLKAQKVESGVDLAELRSDLQLVNDSIGASLQALESINLHQVMQRSTAILHQMQSQPPETVQTLLLKETQKFLELVDKKESNSKKIQVVLTE